jgi:AcrR family transcriptional regulator
MTDTYAAPVSKGRPTTRERILAAALDLFIDRGVAGTTVSDIERAVGLAAGTGSFYRHFRSKEDVVVPAFERGLTQLLLELEADRATLSSIDDPVERRTRDLLSRLNEMRRFHPMWILLLAEHEQFPELQQVFTDVLGVREWDFGWNDDPRRSIEIAALTGFNQFSLLEYGHFAQITPEEFVAALMALTRGTDDWAPAEERG